jgi:hypothetical protein
VNSGEEELRIAGSPEIGGGYEAEREYGEVVGGRRSENDHGAGRRSIASSGNVFDRFCKEMGIPVI